MNLPEATRTTLSHNEHKGESIPFDPATSKLSNITSVRVKPDSTNNAPPTCFAPVGYSPDLPLHHTYDVQGHFAGEYCTGLDYKAIHGFDMPEPMSMSPQGLKRKRESEEISHLDATRLAGFTHGFSPSVTVHPNPYLVEHPCNSCSFLEQGFVSSGLYNGSIGAAEGGA